ncbi:MAG: hypothetical protein H7Y00_08520 [Fimbriimonadaceae bacterium]|nr:hypothetical protein [Chitinophagales bacterium]
MDLSKNKVIHICLTLLLFAAFFSACKKEELIHENVTIPDNIPPGQDGVSDLKLNSYVNNLYIDMFGRAPTEEELSEAKTTLKDNNYNETSREDIITGIMSSYDYYKNINVLTSQKMLVSIDSLTIQYEIDLYEYTIYIAELTGDSVAVFYYEYYLEKLVNLRDASVHLYNSSITINEYFKRYVDNIFYDDVNMGSENFVVSCFENLFHRQPTDDEMQSGIAMVDGEASMLFLVQGNSKDAFINIVGNALEFSQGQVLEAYQTLLARDPSSYEMNEYALQIQETGSFNEMKIDIFKSEEYAGF